jgi:hypothetical protein
LEKSLLYTGDKAFFCNIADSIKIPDSVVYIGDGAFEGDENKETEILNTFLSLAIDPARRVFTKEELVEKYHYPPDDLDSIDLDWT